MTALLQVFFRNEHRIPPTRRHNKSNLLAQPHRMQLHGLVEHSAGENIAIATNHLNLDHLRASSRQPRAAFVCDDQQLVGMPGQKSPFKFGMSTPLPGLHSISYHRTYFSKNNPKLRLNDY